MPQRLIGLDDHVEIDDEAWGLGGLFGKKTGNPLAHDRVILMARRLNAIGGGGR
jgi:hypothetical protein